MIPTKADDLTFERYVRNIMKVWNEAILVPAAEWEGRAWYTVAHDLAEIVGQGDARKGAGIIAALSQNTKWDRNVELAQECANGNVSGHMNSVLDKVRAILEGSDPADVLPLDLKTGHFFQCIYDPTDPDAVVIDRHAHDIAVGERYGNRDRGLGNKNRYATLAHAYREAARRLGELPCVVQAVTWVYWRNMSTSNHGIDQD